MSRTESRLGNAEPKIKQVQLEAVVIRADGTREDLGVVSHSSLLWRFGGGAFLARRRTRKVNRGHTRSQQR